MLTRSNYGKLVRILGAWSILAMILACNVNADDGSGSTPTVTDTPAEEPSGGAAAGGGGGACSRVADCCRAYVGEMGGSVPASTCDAYNNVTGMQDSLCEQTIAGYRGGLTAMSKTVPAACN